MSVLIALALLAPPRSLGEALTAVGALEPPVVQDLAAPPPPDRLGPKILIGAAVATIVAGVGGMLLSGGCATRAADGRCVDQQGSADIYPALVVIGVGMSISGAYWWRQTE